MKLSLWLSWGPYSPEDGSNALNCYVATANQQKKNEKTKKNKKQTEKYTSMDYRDTTLPLLEGLDIVIRNGLTSEAEETFGVFQEHAGKSSTMRLNQVSWNPKVKLHRLGK